jgi:hypothetical protein
MRLVGWGLGAVLSFVAGVGLPACGERIGGDDGTTGTGGAGGSGPFTPAVEPADVCALLSLADIETILPTAGAGVPQPNSTSPDGWGVECDWKDTAPASGSTASLVVVGVLSSAGIADLDRGPQSLAAGATPSSAAVVGLGDTAEYADLTNAQALEAVAGSYDVEVTVTFRNPAVTAVQLRPLVARVLGEI